MTTFFILFLLPLYASCVSSNDLIHPSQAKNELTANVTNLLDDKSSELMADAKNSVKVFFKCLHANRTIEEAVAIAVTTFASSRSTRGIRAEKFTLTRDLRKNLRYITRSPNNKLFSHFPGSDRPGRTCSSSPNYLS